jgi:hypothetical protein
VLNVTPDTVNLMDICMLVVFLDKFLVSQFLFNISCLRSVQGSSYHEPSFSVINKFTRLCCLDCRYQGETNLWDFFNENFIQILSVYIKRGKRFLTFLPLIVTGASN